MIGVPKTDISQEAAARFAACLITVTPEESAWLDRLAESE